ncbi:MAG: hypothetical protein H6610_11180 [Ignavibacteriales bacterium]|nr:hypothetical protein [Ignavibacteriales bacterium]MCB9220005.1 hypothetical protein [Ignavibacteriales bacterium]
MEDIISIELAGYILLITLGLLIIFHILIVVGKVPYNIVWAGKIKSKKELFLMESISLFISLMAVIIVGSKTKNLIFIEDQTIVNTGMWILLALFVFNTIGNLTAKNPIEKYGFGTLTILISFLVLRILVG